MSLTHDFPDRDGLAERGRRAASSDVDSHHSEQHLLPHWETLHPVLVLRHWFLISLHPVITWGTSQIRRRGATVKRAIGPNKHLSTRSIVVFFVFLRFVYKEMLSIWPLTFNNDFRNNIYTLYNAWVWWCLIFCMYLLPSLQYSMM